MFGIKICGITSVNDAQAACSAGADALGLNFYEGSKRFLELPLAAEISHAVSGRVVKVGVFVNAPLEHVKRVHAQLSLDAVQLHGDERPEDIAALRGIPVIKAIRGANRLTLESYLAKCHGLGCSPSAVLVDALHATEYGGTGTLGDWAAASELVAAAGEVPLLLAGGLTPANVVHAIATVHPRGVDVASGVEAASGCKSPELMAQFIVAARRALKNAEGGV